MVKNNYLLITSLFIFLLTAYFSTGFMHPDEHYQILELLNLKFTNYQDLSILNWDFHQRMRSWFQPFLYYLYIFPFKSLDPFQQAFLIRILNGTIALFSLYSFDKYFFKNRDPRRLFFLCLIWFVPFLMVRTSAESLSTSSLLIGLAFYLQQKYHRSSLFFAISFLIKFQMAVFIAPFMLYGLFKKSLPFKDFATMLSLILLVVVVGVFIDYWGYQEWTLSFYQYFYQNLVLNKSSQFGTDPFYFYLITPLIKGIPPISVVLLIGSLYGFIKNQRFQILFACLIYFIIHSFIGHKEVRFLTPLYIISTLLGIDYFLKIKKGKALSIVIGTIFIINIVVLLFVSLKPAHSRIRIYRYFYHKNINQVRVLQSDNNFHFSMPFYMRGNIAVSVYNKKQRPFHLMTLKFTQADEIKSLNCQLEESQYPSWVSSLNFFNWQKRSSAYAIWYCP